VPRPTELRPCAARCGSETPAGSGTVVAASISIGAPEGT
jgi:hypothetical protein